MKISFERRSQPFVDFAHGPKSWPFWRFFAFKFCTLEGFAPPRGFRRRMTGYRLWVYTPKTAYHYDVYIRHRK